MNGPAAFKALNGVFCIYKKRANNSSVVLDLIKTSLSKGELIFFLLLLTHTYQIYFNDSNII